jgi:hypothetical protein
MKQDIATRQKNSDWISDYISYGEINSDIPHWYLVSHAKSILSSVIGKLTYSPFKTLGKVQPMVWNFNIGTTRIMRKTQAYKLSSSLLSLLAAENAIHPEDINTLSGSTAGLKKILSDRNGFIILERDDAPGFFNEVQQHYHSGTIEILNSIKSGVGLTDNLSHEKRTIVSNYFINLMLNGHENLSSYMPMTMLDNGFLNRVDIYYPENRDRTTLIDDPEDEYSNITPFDFSSDDGQYLKNQLLTMYHNYSNQVKLDIDLQDGTYNETRIEVTRPRPVRELISSIGLDYERKIKKMDKDDPLIGYYGEATNKIIVSAILYCISRNISPTNGKIEMSIEDVERGKVDVEFNILCAQRMATLIENVDGPELKLRKRIIKVIRETEDRISLTELIKKVKPHNLGLSAVGMKRVIYMLLLEQECICIRDEEGTTTKYLRRKIEVKDKEMEVGLTYFER